MKNYLGALWFLLQVLNLYGQDTFNAYDARIFAKGFCRQLFNECPRELSPRELDLSIHKWEAVELDTKKYMIEMTVQWVEGEYFGRRTTKAHGYLIVNEFGCEPMFLTKDHTIMNILGITCLEKLSSNHQAIIKDRLGVEATHGFMGTCIEE